MVEQICKSIIGGTAIGEGEGYLRVPITMPADMVASLPTALGVIKKTLRRRLFFLFTDFFGQPLLDQGLIWHTPFSGNFFNLFKGIGI